MIDLISLLITAGDGGDGKISFHREKYVPKGGPDGGVGGDGGSVVLVGTRRFNTLKHFAGKKEILASSGERGGRRKKTGAKGEDTVIEVPLGTVVWLAAESENSALRARKYGIEHTFTRGEVEFERYFVQKATENPVQREKLALQPVEPRRQLIVMTQEGQRVVLAQGGFGGRGNMAFKGPANTTPLEAEYGTFGERKAVTLELKLLADIGLVGYPNAGKSTLLSKVTKAHPKIANYPFTTIEPNLGVLNTPQGDLVLADIPGLIEGAHEGKGLGRDFLRHIENCRVLVFVLFLEESVVSDDSLSAAQKAEMVWQQYQQLVAELREYRAEMLQKPSLIALNKIDIYSPELVTVMEKRFADEKLQLVPFSGFTGAGLQEVTAQITERAARPDQD